MQAEAEQQRVQFVSEAKVAGHRVLHAEKQLERVKHHTFEVQGRLREETMRAENAETRALELQKLIQPLDKNIHHIPLGTDRPYDLANATNDNEMNGDNSSSDDDSDSGRELVLERRRSDPIDISDDESTWAKNQGPAKVVQPLDKNHIHNILLGIDQPYNATNATNDDDEMNDGDRGREPVRRKGSYDKGMNDQELDREYPTRRQPIPKPRKFQRPCGGQGPVLGGSLPRHMSPAAETDNSHNIVSILYPCEKYRAN